MCFMAFLGFTTHAQYSAINVNSQLVTKGIGAVASDNDGNMIVTGNFNTTITIGGYTLTNSNPEPYGSNAAFIAKMNSAGSYTWVKNIVINKPLSKKICGTLYSGVEILGVSTDVSGNIYLTGSFYGSVSFGSTTLATIQRSGAGACGTYDVNIFTAKMSPSGNFLWAKQEGIRTDHSSDSGNSVTSDAAGNVYTTGRLIQMEVNTVDCDPSNSCGTQAGSSLCPALQLYAYVVKYNATGLKIWEKKYANNYANCQWTPEGTSIVSDGSNIYVAGHFIQTVNFGNGFSFTAGTINLFLLKLDGNGNTIWATTANTNVNAPNRLILDNEGQDIYVSGRFSGTSSFGTFNLTATGTNQYLAKYSASAGICSWAINTGYNATYTKGRPAFKHPNGNVGIVAKELGMLFSIKEYSTVGSFVTETTATNVNTTDGVADIVSMPGGFVYSQNLKGSYDMGGTPIVSTQPSTSNFRDLMLVKYVYTAPPSIARKPTNEKFNQISGDELHVRISQNPTHDRFLLLIKSNDKNPVSIRVLDVQGRILETRNANPNEGVIMIGEKLQPGIYYAEIIQGDERHIEKILKIE